MLLPCALLRNSPSSKSALEQVLGAPRSLVLHQGGRQVFKGRWQQQLYRKIQLGLAFDLRQISQNAAELTLFGEVIVLVLNLVIAKEIHVTATINVFTLCTKKGYAPHRPYYRALP
jgi:hypothetical protein